MDEYKDNLRLYLSKSAQIYSIRQSISNIESAEIQEFFLDDDPENICDVRHRHPAIISVIISSYEGLTRKLLVKYGLLAAQ